MKKAYLCVAILLIVVIVETAILTMNVASGQPLVTETNHALDKLPLLNKLPETREEYFSDLESLGCELIQITNGGKSGDFSVLKYESFRSIAFESKVVFFYVSPEHPEMHPVDFFTIFEGQSFRMSVTYEE